jgi:hypothetical protein
MRGNRFHPGVLGYRVSSPIRNLWFTSLLSGARMFGSRDNDAVRNPLRPYLDERIDDT